jgi:ADP-heptose:LPS heptosyltransferase
LANTSDRAGACGAENVARELLRCCLAGEAWPKRLARDLARCALDNEEASRALFGILAEGLSDRFEPCLVEQYAALFSEVIPAAAPECSAAELLERYSRVRKPRRFEGDAAAVRTVFVLSRVTLGADVAVTSLVLDAAKRRFSNAEIVLVGGSKAYGLFAADPRIGHLAITYGRGGTLRERIAVLPQLRAGLCAPASIVIDPDSRLTQLGLLPVCSEENYFFFESRAYGGGGADSLVALARRWIEETFGVAGSRAYIAPAEEIEPEPGALCVSLGVGENPAKRLPDPFEEELLRLLAGRGYPILADTGAGGEEEERVTRAIARAGVEERVRTWRGSFAAFAGAIARSALYVGYDSAGQHVAAACGTPLLSVFAGFSCRRMFERWRPDGPGPIEVVRVEDADPHRVLAQAAGALERLLT